MEFWGEEVKPGKPVFCEAGDGFIIHLSQAALGETKRSENIVVSVKVGDKKLVIGTLADKHPQVMCDLIFDQDFEISHNSKTTSVFMCGYKSALLDMFESDSGEEEDKEIEADTMPMITNETDSSSDDSQDESESGEDEVVSGTDNFSDDLEYEEDSVEEEASPPPSAPLFPIPQAAGAPCPQVREPHGVGSRPEPPPSPDNGLEFVCDLAPRAAMEEQIYEIMTMCTVGVELHSKKRIDPVGIILAVSSSSALVVAAIDGRVKKKDRITLKFPHGKALKPYVIAESNGILGMYCRRKLFDLNQVKAVELSDQLPQSFNTVYVYHGGRVSDGCVTQFDARRFSVTNIVTLDAEYGAPVLNELGHLVGLGCSFEYHLTARTVLTVQEAIEGIQKSCILPSMSIEAMLEYWDNMSREMINQE